MISISHAWMLLFGCLLVYGWVAAIYPQRKRVLRFSNREELPTQQIFERYYKHLGLEEETVSELWKDAAQALNIPAGKLRPSDSFDNEFRPVFGFPLVDLNEEFLSVMLKRLRKKYPKSQLRDLMGIHSLDDYIMFFSNV